MTRISPATLEIDDPTRPLWIFMHVPKCGGTTLKAHLERHFAMDERLMELSNWGRRYRRKRGRPEFGDRSDAERARIDVLAGHQISYGIHQKMPGAREARYVTVVRDPAERCVSLYNFRWSRGFVTDDFDGWYRDWYRVREANFQVHFFAERLFGNLSPVVTPDQLETVKRLLARFWFVTTTDRLNDGLDFLSREMGIPADWQHFRKAGASLPLPDSHPDKKEVVQKRVTLTDEMRRMIYADSPFDLALVEWVRGHHWRSTD